MHKLNNGIHACVFPTRCGTRWIGKKLFDHNLLDYAAPHHMFDLNEFDSNLQNIMFVRNPFTRERSIFRWKAIIQKDVYENITFSDYVNSELFYHEPSYIGTYQDNINLINKFVHLEDISDFLHKTFNIKSEYILDYHFPVDDLDDVSAFDNNMKDRVLEKYAQDIKLIDFNLTSYI
jgi:hypothetical protein|tara:strand:- start:474 stop:1004 length:531 start_codon:yes stop_codon:yes gene_type:complete